MIRTTPITIGSTMGKLIVKDLLKTLNPIAVSITTIPKISIKIFIIKISPFTLLTNFYLGLPKLR